MSNKIDITGLSKAAVLVALFNGVKKTASAAPLLTNAELTLSKAEEVLGGRSFGTPYTGQPHKVDYVEGRAIKVDLTDDTIDPTQYDAANGEGAAARAIQALRDATV